ncbi:MAG TPA: hypothetical protein VLZ03_10795, partial [Thermodesulfobacteriota bacterium]|nr:hypothetical protein [Thermodesulfobacteriota bacterium]
VRLKSQHPPAPNEEARDTPRKAKTEEDLESRLKNELNENGPEKVGRGVGMTALQIDGDTALRL